MKKLDGIFIKTKIAEPIIKFETEETIVIEDFNKDIEKKEYYFTVKNYQNEENNKKRISEISFEMSIKIIKSNYNFPASFRLYCVKLENNEEKEITLENNKVENIFIEKNKEFANKYKLIVISEKNINDNLKTDIDIQVKVNQVKE